MQNFNSDNSKIDAALKAHDDDIAALETSMTAWLAAKGNCKIELLSYQGDGTTSRTFTFEGAPYLLYILAPSGQLTTLYGANRAFGFSGANRITPNAAWNGSALTLSGGTAEVVCNVSGTTYQMAVLTAQDAS